MAFPRSFGGRLETRAGSSAGKAAKPLAPSAAKTAGKAAAPTGGYQKAKAGIGSIRRGIGRISGRGGR